MKGNDVEWVWQIKPGAGTVWSYDKGGAQRRIPRLAISNLTNPKLWYEPR